MVLKILLLLFNFSFSQNSSKLIIWNVGQGQHITHLNESTCWHFDLGGEHFDWKKLKYLCGDKKNAVIISHVDYDHLNGLSQAWRHLKQICIFPPSYQQINLGKYKTLLRYSKCADHWLKQNFILQINRNHNLNVKRENQLSRVLLLKNKVLIPGDSTSVEEKIWSKNISKNIPIQLLILGHHGSKTSTSKALLQRLPHLQMAIASSRYQKYRHPHPETLYRLKKNKTPVLKTEDWGHIIFEL